MSRAPAFDGKAQQYASYRFDYPEAFVAEAFAKVSLGPVTRVAELGCGTGLLTRHLLRAAARVHGVEPSADMRAEAQAALQGTAGLVMIAGTAEATGLAATSVDVLVAGNAFHYFDPVRARAEADRILTPGGRILFLDHRIPQRPSAFVSAYMAFFRRWTPPDLATAHADDAVPRRLATFFGDRPYHSERVLEQDYSMTWERLRGRFLSTSIAPAPERAEFETVLGELRDLYDAHQQGGVVSFPLDWACTWSR
jgi:SAM-dependent methyltransferase